MKMAKSISAPPTDLPKIRDNQIPIEDFYAPAFSAFKAKVIYYLNLFKR